MPIETTPAWIRVAYPPSNVKPPEIPRSLHHWFHDVADAINGLTSGDNAVLDADGVNDLIEDALDKSQYKFYEYQVQTPSFSSLTMPEAYRSDTLLIFFDKRAQHRSRYAEALDEDGNLTVINFNPDLTYDTELQLGPLIKVMYIPEYTL